jgi:hypothetical protein
VSFCVYVAEDYSRQISSAYVSHMPALTKNSREYVSHMPTLTKNSRAYVSVSHMPQTPAPTGSRARPRRPCLRAVRRPGPGSACWLSPLLSS